MPLYHPTVVLEPGDEITFDSIGYYVIDHSRDTVVLKQKNTNEISPPSEIYHIDEISDMIRDAEQFTVYPGGET